MRAVGDSTPVAHVIALVQDAWLGFGWNWPEALIVTSFLVGAALLTVLLASTGRLGTTA